MARVVAEVRKNPNENNMLLLRRFNRRVQEANVIRTVKQKRFRQRLDSKLDTKDWALKRLAKRKEFQRLEKLGKATKR